MTDMERRFGGVARLYGNRAAQRIQQAHVAVVGVGGVGCWAAEALARSGVGQITLIDLDVLVESNTNRQLHALGDAYGKAKVEAMAERILAINPHCQVQAIDDFISPENVATLLAPLSQHPLAGIIDAIDQVHAKAAMLSWCRQMQIPIICAGAAGGKMDPTAIRIDDLALVQQDRLLARLRSELRRHHGFPKAAQSASKPQRMGVSAVYSTEPARQGNTAVADAPAEGQSSPGAPQSGSGGLNCAGYGSSVCVTAAFGFAATAWLLRRLAD